MSAHESSFMTLAEAARALRLSVSTLKRYIYAGLLPTYRTPGGRHRVRRADIEDLLGAPPREELAGTALAVPAEAVVEQVVRALRRRLDQVEVDLERLQCSLEVIARAAGRVAATHPAARPQRVGGCDIKVLGPGCRACDQLARLVVEVARALGLTPERVRRVQELDEIAEYGPTPMPALVVNDQVVSAGRLPSKSRLLELMKHCLPN